MLFNIDVNSDFSYLWLKQVFDVDLSQHCAKCLIGPYITEINKNISCLHDFELNEGIFYLCGVSHPFVWKNNFHLAFKYQLGSILDYSMNGITVHICNAIQIPFSIRSIDFTHPKAKFKSYYSCRNWQFAHHYNTFLKQI